MLEQASESALSGKLALCWLNMYYYTVVMPTDRANILLERLRAAGLRVTPQRRAVWAAFRGGERGHLTADEVYEVARHELPELSRATVYNSLAELVRAELLQTVKGLGAVRYDPNLDPDHHHFHCQGCDRLYDVHLQTAEHLQLLGEEEFVVDRKSVLFEGYCSLCSQTAR